MKTMLKVNRLINTLGEIFINIINLTKKWLKELSQKSHFLLSYWQPAYSYGQTSIRQTPNRSLKVMLNKYVYQAHQVGPIALTTKKTKTLETNHSEIYTVNSKKVNSGIGKKLKGFTYSLNIDKFKVRVLNGLYTFWDNKRLRWGMLFLLIIAPASKFFYMLFPENGFGEYLVNLGPVKVLNSIEGMGNWFYVTFYYYFFSVGELAAPVLSTFGIFLLFPKKYYPSYLVGVPFGYYLSMVVHRMFFVTSNADMLSGFTTTMTLSFLILGVVFFAVSDKVLFKQNHRKRASEARIIGLINMPGMEWTDKEEIIRKEVAEVMKVDNELFVKESA